MPRHVHLVIAGAVTCPLDGASRAARACRRCRWSGGLRLARGGVPTRVCLSAAGPSAGDDFAGYTASLLEQGSRQPYPRRSR